VVTAADHQGGHDTQHRRGAVGVRTIDRVLPVSVRSVDGGSKTVNSPPGEELVFSFHNTGVDDLPSEMSGGRTLEV